MALEEGRLSTELAASSKEIAEASMRDASAMKSISVLTMVFLPATAVAVRSFPRGNREMVRLKRANKCPVYLQHTLLRLERRQ